MINIDELVRKNVLKLTPYSCARDEFKGKTGVFLDANENPFGTLNRYPDPYQSDLKSAISKFKSIPAENIFLGNGSDEIIDLCFRIFCNPGTDKVLTFTPTYGMYEVSASVNDTEIIRIPLNSNFQIDTEKADTLFSDSNLKMIFICSPNNPTGNCMDHADIEYLIKKFRGIVIIDEAYIDFTDKPSFSNMVNRYPNLIVMQTFSKAFGLAAVRVGMAFANHDIIKYFNKMKPPYNISTINQKAALMKLAKSDDSKRKIELIKKEKRRLIPVLEKMKITEKVYPSDANFLLVKVKNATEIYNILINKCIIVRNRSSVIENCLRITIGKRTENNKLIAALNSISI